MCKRMACNLDVPKGGADMPARITEVRVHVRYLDSRGEKTPDGCVGVGLLIHQTIGKGAGLQRGIAAALRCGRRDSAWRDRAMGER